MTRKAKTTHINYVFIATLVVASIAVFALLQFITASSRGTITTTQLSKMSGSMGEYSQSIQLQIELMKGNLESLARTETVTSTKSEECSKRLKDNLDGVFTIFNTLSRTNKSGYFDCSTREETIGKQALGAGYEYIDEIFADPRHESIVSRLKSTSSDLGTTFIAIHVPVFNNGEFQGTLGSAILMNRIGAESFDTKRDFARSDFIILDDNEDIIYENGISNVVKKLTTSRVAQSEMKSVARLSISKDIQSELIEQKNQSNYIVQPIVLSKERTWYMVAHITDANVLASVGNSNAGMRIVRGERLTQIVGSVFLGLIVAACTTTALSLYGRWRL